MFARKIFYIALTTCILINHLYASSYVALINNYSSNSVSVVDLPLGGTPINIPVGSAPYDIVTTPNMQTAYVTNSGDNTVSVIDVFTNSVTGSPIPVGTSPYYIAITPDGSKAFVTNNGSANVSVIDIASNTVSATIPAGNGPDGILITPDGKKVYVTNDIDNTVTVINALTNKAIAAITVGNQGGYGSTATVTPDSAYVYVPNYNDGTVTVIRTCDNRTCTLMMPDGGQASTAFAISDGTKIYVPADNSNFIAIIETFCNTLSADTILVGLEPYDIAFSQDGSTAYVGNALDGTISLIDVPTDSSIETFAGGPSPDTLALAPDADHVLVVFNYAPGTLGSIDIANNNTLTTIAALQDNPYYVAFGFLLAPPTHLRARQSKIEFGFQITCTNILHWDPPNKGVPPVAYNVYRNNKLLGVVSADCSLKYKDYDCYKGVQYTYSVRSKDAEGNLSEPTSVIINESH